MLMAGRVQAQPALERLEKGVRRQIVPPTESPSPAAVPRAEPGYLGIITEKEDGRRQGVAIREAVAGSPGAKAGLAAGDVITSIGDHPVRDIGEMATALRSLAAGADVTFVIERGGEAQQVRVVLGKRPPVAKRRYQEFGEIKEQPTARDEAPAQADLPEPRDAPPAAQRPRLGIRTELLTEQDRRELKLSGGAKITSVRVGSAAEKAGLPLGAVITSVDGQPVASPAEMAVVLDTIPTGTPIDLMYVVDGQKMRKQITLAATAPRAVPRPAPRPRAAADDEPPALAPAAADDEAPPAGFEGPVDPFARIAELEARVRELEERLSRLEKEAPQPAK